VDGVRAVDAGHDAHSSTQGGIASETARVDESSGDDTLCI
jgi:hypothetical protein